ncbi:hypothetical protein BHE74_00059121 [Ensete ventricosum]|nr:hypothetical protein BHE74_00059121 [Ensete ventricosum]
MLPNDASDFGLIVANGTYSITAGQCVQLYCTPASLSVSCSSMQCRGSNLVLGNITARSSSAGCSVTSCTYGGFVNGSIVTKLYCTPASLPVSWSSSAGCSVTSCTYGGFVNGPIVTKFTASLQPRCPDKLYLWLISPFWRKTSAI